MNDKQQSVGNDDRRSIERMFGSFYRSVDRFHSGSYESNCGPVMVFMMLTRSEVISRAKL